MPVVECVIDAHAECGESAIWDAPEAALFWADIDGNTLFRYDPATDENRAFDMGEKVGALAIRESGAAIIGTESGIHSYDFATRTKTQLADPEADFPGNRFNDSVTDRDGRFWLGSMSMLKPQPADAAFYRVDADLSVSRQFDGIYTTNGLAFSPDGTTLYFSDSYAEVRTIWACDYDRATGTPSNRRVFFDTRAVAGRPDGGTVDADGCYWMAGVGGWQMVRLTPEGAVDMVIDMPVERPSKPAFGGPDLKTMFVTSIGANQTPGSDQPHAGGLFAITGLPVGGFASVRFRG
ncbi:MAG: SMP-30/gluconolactonase/LRE family protein [Acuticoccus sp.]